MVITCNGETYIIPKKFEEEVRRNEREKVIELYTEFCRKNHSNFDEEWKAHIDLEDNKSIFMFSMEQYVKVKFAYNWLKGELQSEKPVDVEKEIRKKTLDEVYSIAMNENHDTLIEWLQENIID